MKKAVSLFLVFALAVGMLAGCGDKNNNSKSAESKDTQSKAVVSDSAESGEKKEAVTLDFWTISLQPTFTDFFNGLIKDYETQHSNVTVNWTDLPYDSIQQKLVTATAGGTAPDVVNLNTQLTLTLAGKGALVDLEADATDAQKSIYVESLYDSARIGNSVYAFPWYASPNIMFYNKELFEKAGITEIPSEYQAAFEMAKTMKEKTGAYLFQPQEFFNLLFEYDIPILNAENTAAAFNTKETADLLTAFKAMTDNDDLTKTKWGEWDTALKLFETEKLAIISSSGSSLARIKDEAPDVYEKIAIAAPMTGSTGLSQNPLMNLVVPSASKNHEEAIAFAAFITNDANQLAFCKEVAIFPSTIAATEDAFFTSDTTTLEGIARKMSVDVSKTSKDYSLGVEGQSEIQTAVDKIYEAVIVNGADIQQTLDAQEKAVNLILNK